MAIQKIHRFHALKPGAQVWFAPQKVHSGWTRQLDWYLNFQICQYENKKPHASIQEINKIMIEEEIRFDLELKHPKNLMISAQEYLPTQALVILQDNTLEEQILEIQTYIKDLSLESIRVFLPQKVSASEFVKKWPNAKNTADFKVSLVEDI